MNKKKYFLIFTLLVVVTGFLIIVIQSTGDADKFSFLKSKTPDKLKRYLKNNISYFKVKELEKQSLKLNNKNIIINKKRVSNWRKLSENYMNSMDLFLEKHEQKKILSTDKTEYTLTKYKIPFFDLDYYEWEQKPIGYLEQTEKKVYFVSGNGVFILFDKTDIGLNKIPMRIIDTNLKEVILDESFFNIDRISVKDLLIDDGYIYLAYTREQKEDCYNTAILRSKVSEVYLKFEDFFVYDDCVPTSYQEWNAHQTGGTMFSSKGKGEIFFSIGEFRDRIRAQDKNSIFGKIVKINVIDQNYEIISMGHRNVQGLYYNAEKEKLIMSEHGPRGGDEININHKVGNEIENYGWPVSSYGEHYNKKYPRPEAPLKKSHAKYGFIEPLKYWDISIGIGRIKHVPSNFNNNFEDNSYFLGSMGWLPKQGHKTLYHLVLDDDHKKIIKENKVVINERIRDIDFDTYNKNVYLVLENTPGLALLKINKN